jgi:hypothetical protein
MSRRSHTLFFVVYGLITLQFLVGIAALFVLPQGEYGGAGWTMLLICGAALAEGVVALTTHMIAWGYNASREITLPEE